MRIYIFGVAPPTSAACDGSAAEVRGATPETHSLKPTPQTVTALLEGA